MWNGNVTNIFIPMEADEGVIESLFLDGDVLYILGWLNFTIGNFQYGNVAKFDLTNKQWLTIDPISSIGETYVYSALRDHDKICVFGLFTVNTGLSVRIGKK